MRHSPLVIAASVVIFELGLATTTTAQIAEKATPHYVDAALAAYAASDVVDMISSGRSLSGGAREANPFLHPFANNPVAFGVVNAATRGTTTYILWKMAKHHPKRAAIISTVLTSIELSVAMHNFDVARRPR